MHPFVCGQCSATVFFENDFCLSCAAVLGFAPAEGRMLAFTLPTDLATGAPWPRGDGGMPLHPCANRDTAAHCNWMRDNGDADIDAGTGAGTVAGTGAGTVAGTGAGTAAGTAPGAPVLCCSCRLTQLLPTLDLPENRSRWQRIEQAKRRLVHTLLGLGLVPQPKQGPHDTCGLAFLLLADQPGAASVHTGHDSGTITLNVAEADDDHREAERVRLGEPARTLLGHLRHEAAHYLQHRWIAGTTAADTCRASFGDERADYGQALARHYADGPPPDWAQHYISAYASAHPWEDWAETCAHYLLVLDAVQTASAWGLQLSGPVSAAPQARDLADAPDVQQLVLQQWLPVAQFLNAMNRSLGRRDSYPFLLPPAVLNKMTVVQQLLQAAAGGAGGAYGAPGTNTSGGANAVNSQSALAR